MKRMTYKVVIFFSFEIYVHFLLGFYLCIYSLQNSVNIATQEDFIKMLLGNSHASYKGDGDNRAFIPLICIFNARQGYDTPRFFFFFFFPIVSESV